MKMMDLLTRHDALEAEDQKIFMGMADELLAALTSKDGLTILMIDRTGEGEMCIMAVGNSLLVPSMLHAGHEVGKQISAQMSGENVH